MKLHSMPWNERNKVSQPVHVRSCAACNVQERHASPRVSTTAPREKAALRSDRNRALYSAIRSTGNSKVLNLGLTAVSCGDASR